MSEELETCPKCGEGKLRPVGRVSVEDKASTREYRCDNGSCGMKKVDQGLIE